MSIIQVQKDCTGWSKEATKPFRSTLITVAPYRPKSGERPPKHSHSPLALLFLCSLPPRADGKALQFLKRCRAQSQISAQVLIWPPNGIIQTQAFITHINERAEPGHPCSGTHPPTKSKDGWKSSRLKGSREKGKTASRNPLLYPSLPSSASLCLCSHRLPYSALIRTLSSLAFLRLPIFTASKRGERHKAVKDDSANLQRLLLSSPFLQKIKWRYLLTPVFEECERQLSQARKEPLSM